MGLLGQILPGSPPCVSVALWFVSALARDHPSRRGLGVIIPLSRASCWFCLLSLGLSHRSQARNSGVFCSIFLVFQKGNRGAEGGDSPKITQQAHVRGDGTLVSPGPPGALRWANIQLVLCRGNLPPPTYTAHIFLCNCSPQFTQQQEHLWGLEDGWGTNSSPAQKPDEQSFYFIDTCF